MALHTFASAALHSGLVQDAHRAQRPPLVGARGSPASAADEAVPHGVRRCSAMVLVGLGVASSTSSPRRRRGRSGRGMLRSSADAVWPMPEEDKKTLRQVVIVHRHGTRFPTKPSGPGNLGWPVRAQFWDSYKGHLTPLGAKLLTDTG
ncbi:Hypothetical protein (Fragment), partial [Durusdinium trenchii]